MSLPSPSVASSDATLVPSSSTFGGGAESINVQIYVPEYNVQKCLQTNLDDTVWEVKQKILALLPKDMQEGFNYGLFLPPCNGRAGKFLLEERPLRDYPFQDCVPYLELKYKKRVYKMLNLDEKALKHLHTKSTLKKFLEHVEERQAEKVEKLCAQGLDPNFHDGTGETPLTIAASVDDNNAVLLALTSGGAHLDFRNLEGQTALHKAAFLASHANVKTLLELGTSPNYKDPLGLTPLYYCMLKPNTNPNTAELLLRDYADLGVTDPHGNEEVHQACKNGLVPHLEHLLFYGAEINCQNVNGNTPLHVCAVNNQDACARVLLFRGADPNIVNNQGQTAFHVAVITGHHGVAELIRMHDPSTAVPYRGVPRYNSKRRLARRSPAGSTGRPRSIGGSTAGSECGYGTILRGAVQRMHGVRPALQMGCPTGSPMASIPPSPNVIRPLSGPSYCQHQPPPVQHYGAPFMGNGQQQRTLHQAMPAFSGNQTMPPDCRPAVLQMIKKSISEQNAVASVGHLATIRGSMDNSAAMAPPPIQRIPPELAAQFGASTLTLNSDVNIPRILVIPRGPKGFGFILRGAKKVDAAVNFEPTPEIPALQYFEGVDMNGMAMKAGLKPGDFLLEINGNDVRCASHDQVVRLIQLSGDTISLKVITIDPNEPLLPVPYYGTLRRNSKTAPPPPPLRHPATSLSITAGRSVADVLGRYDEYAIAGSVPHRIHHQSRSLGYPNAATMGIAKSTEHLPVAYRDPREKAPSVRGRVNSRRISAAELEQLMARQNSSGSNTSSNATSFCTETDSPGTPTAYRNGSIGGGPKVYNSVAEMKRQKLQRTQQQCQQMQPRGSIVLVDPTDTASLASTAPSSANSLKSFHSSPDLKGSELELVRGVYPDEQQQVYHQGHAQMIYGNNNNNNGGGRTSGPSLDKTGYGVPMKYIQRPKTPPPAPPVNAPRSAAIRNVAAPPPPRQDYQRSYACRGSSQAAEQPHIPEPDYDDPPAEEFNVASAAPSTAAPVPPPPPPPPAPQPPCNDLKSALTMKRQQILQKSSSNSDEVQSSAVASGTAAASNGHGGAEQKNVDSGKANFNSDLRNAIARRRTQLDQQQRSGDAAATATTNGDDTAKISEAKSGRVVGLSLKESVQNTIQTSVGSNGWKNACPSSSGGEGGGKNVKTTNGSHHAGGNNSPPISNGFAQKKDSGFSSSRNSLEPSECEETASTAGGESGETAVAGNEDTLRQNRVTFISHQLEDSIGGPQIRGRPPLQSKPSSTQQNQNHRAVVKRLSSSADQQDAISLASTLSTLSGCSDATASSAVSQQQPGHRRSDKQQSDTTSKDFIPPMPQGPPPVPPPDYEAADSGTGDSENDDVTPTLSQQTLAHQSNSFRNRALISWSVADVCDWLDSLYLSEYKRGFSRSNVDGRRLTNCDRTQFTQLGVTRIAHRIAMENSLKVYRSEKR